MQLIYKLGIALLLASHSFNGFSQAQLSRNLEQQLNKSSEDWIYINLHLSEKVDMVGLQKSFKSKHTPISERAKSTLKLLQETASKSQKEILQILNKNSTSCKEIKSFWVANIISLKAKPDLVYLLQNQKSISFISSDDHSYFYHQPTKAEEITEKGLTEAEKGIYAINAPALWEMGYTGKNRIVLGVDTGVKDKHPSISDNFLGKYRPLHETWYGYSNITPEDISFSSTHGTHTLGTVLGLDKNTNDTVGVAYNAYWMAADPIVSAISDVRTLGKILESFQFALNPDGDINTTHDIPDVITNSWGWDSFYSNEDCYSPEADAINAAVAAGIGVVFSAGNDGPGVSTVGQPANLAQNLFNVFSVGAIDGNNPSYPIADFSSHGPTTCVDEADGYSLWVKPEIVAPGVNVRSAMGDDTYGNLSGTSMACPHVAGAFLLLKEAFPYLAGEDILKGLYYSAIDLGDEGEDNIFGKGIIDVKAAYDYLAQENTPAEPVSNSYDIALWKVTDAPVGYTTEDNFSVTFEIKNLGTESVQGVNYYVQVNELEAISLTNNEALAPNETLSITVDNNILESGINSVKLYCDLSIDVAEADLINNTHYFTITKPQEVNLPFTENFDTTNFTFTNSLFSYVNHDKDWTWVVDTAGGLPNSTYAMRLDFTKMKNRNNETDDLISPVFVIPESEDKISFWFKYAYKARMATLFKDSLQVSISEDFGNTWNDTLFAKGDEGLATVDGYTSNNRFVPKSEDDWAELKFDLSSHKGKKIMIRYRGINDNGSNLYIDDIRLFEGENPVKINSSLATKTEWQLFPNPARQKLHIKISNTKNTQLIIYNTLGIQMAIYELNNHSQSINISTLPKGVYFAKLKGNAQSVKRFIKD